MISRDQLGGSAALAFAVALMAAALLFAGGCSDDAQACDRSTECGSRSACLSGTCQSLSCRTRLDCPADAICLIDEDGSGRCGAQECRTNNDCGADRDAPYCVGGRCVDEAPAECTARRDCNTGETCAGNQCDVVEEGAVCDDDEDCGNPQVCDPHQGEAGLCVDRCSSDGECEALEGLRSCDPPSGLCIPVECLRDDDCGDDERCSEDATCELERFPCDELSCDDPGRPFKTAPLEGLCRCVACLSDNNCVQTAPDVCGDGSDCACTGGNRCVSCSVRASDASECPVDRPFFRDGCCVVCLSDLDCEPLGLGSICQAGDCVTCDCNAGCECTGDAECVDQDDDSGRCQRPLGQLGDPCTAQDDCETFLACNYSTGECVTQGTSSFCGSGCPEPMRCAAVSGGAFCYGCDPDNDACPVGNCEVRAEWVGVFDGGRCTP